MADAIFSWLDMIFMPEGQMTLGRTKHLRGASYWPPIKLYLCCLAFLPGDCVLRQPYVINASCCGLRDNPYALAVPFLCSQFQWKFCKEELFLNIQLFQWMIRLLEKNYLWQRHRRLKSRLSQSRRCPKWFLTHPLHPAEQVQWHRVLKTGALFLEESFSRIGGFC